jgi:hypothetical protein
VKNLVILILFLIPFAAHAQEIHNTKTTKLDIGHPAYFPSFGNDKDLIFISGPNYKGLSVFDAKNHTEQSITDVLGAGNQPVMEPSGKIAYHEIQLVNGRKHRSLKTVESSYKSDSKVKIENTNQVKVNGNQIEIYQNNQWVQSISPVGINTNYLWASLSPNQNQLLFTAAGKGSFVSNIKGEMVVKLGYLNAPQWLNDQWIVGMNDKDNGEQITSSTLDAIHVNTQKRISLTSEKEVIALYPKISPTSDRLVFNTPEGDIYMLEFTINE